MNIILGEVPTSEESLIRIHIQITFIFRSKPGSVYKENQDHD